MAEIMLPYVVLQCTEAFLKFRGIVCELDMPVVDLQEAVDQIVDSVGVRDDEDHELILTAFNMAESDSLFENHELDSGQQERVYNAVLDLGRSMKKEIDFQYGYVKDGIFPYEFKALINNDTIVFTRKLE